MGYCIFLRKGETHTPPSADILASNLAVGDIVKLTENGTPVEYIVVNQGIPENSSLYDASCNGTWLLRKECLANRAWDVFEDNVYSTSSINQWLRGDFFNSFGNVEQAVIKQVKIPYRKDGGYGVDQSGADGLSCKVFLLGGYEVGFTTNNSSYFPVDGAKLSYFESGTNSSALNKRIAYLNGIATDWWLRSPKTNSEKIAWYISVSGSIEYQNTQIGKNVRPALILPFTAKFDKDTKILKG